MEPAVEAELAVVGPATAERRAAPRRAELTVVGSAAAERRAATRYSTTVVTASRRLCDRLRQGARDQSHVNGAAARQRQPRQLPTHSAASSAARSGARRTSRARASQNARSTAPRLQGVGYVCVNT